MGSGICMYELLLIAGTDSTSTCTKLYSVKGSKTASESLWLLSFLVAALARKYVLQVSKSSRLSVPCF